jgi:uncharacterized protein YegL
MTIPRSGVERPAWITAGTKQLAVLVRDCSPSTSGQKARDASEAGRELATELANPMNHDGFDVAVVDFARAAKLANDVTPAGTLVSTLRPIAVHGGSTNLTAGLEIARDVIRRPEFQDESHLRPVVVAFTDGCHNTGPHPRDIAAEVKQLADLVTVAFGEDADEALLRDQATSPQHFYRCRNGGELRTFFAAVGRTLTVSLQRRQNATQALSQIHLQ